MHRFVRVHVLAVAEGHLPKRLEAIESPLLVEVAEHGALPKNFEAAGWDLVNLFAQAVKSAGPSATPDKICEAIRKEEFKGVLVAKRNFGAADMTGIKLSDFVFSKVTSGVYSRTDFRLKE